MSSAPSVIVDSRNSSENRYIVMKKLGAGAFGTVYLTYLDHSASHSSDTPTSSGHSNDENPEEFAVKETFQDMRYKNREAEILEQLDHPGVIEVHDIFYTEKANQTFLNIAMKYYPGTLHDLLEAKETHRAKLSYADIQWYSLQLFRTCGYLETLSLCHRDIKPQNILVDPKRKVIKMCDFGSAKQLVDSEANKHYICSRFYRAPELLCKSTRYTCSVDLWSVGCCLGEMYLGRPLFNGVNTRHQLRLISDVLGDTPTNYPSRSRSKYTSRRGAKASAVTWMKTLKIAQNAKKLAYPMASKPCADLEFLRSVLQYDPAKRPNLAQTLGHAYYKDIVQGNSHADGQYPKLQWTQHEKNIIRSLR